MDYIELIQDMTFIARIGNQARARHFMAQGALGIRLIKRISVVVALEEFKETAGVALVGLPGDHQRFWFEATGVRPSVRPADGSTSG